MMTDCWKMRFPSRRCILGCETLCLTRPPAPHTHTASPIPMWTESAAASQVSAQPPWGYLVGATHMTKGIPVLNREGDSLMFGSLCPRDSRACLGRMAGHLGQGLGWGKRGPSSIGGKRWHSPVHLHTSQAGGPLGPSHILSL